MTQNMQNLQDHKTHRPTENKKKLQHLITRFDIICRHDHSANGMPRLEQGDVTVGPLEPAGERVGRQLFDGVSGRQVA
jgi:hypothetical protein